MVLAVSASYETGEVLFGDGSRRLSLERFSLGIVNENISGAVRRCHTFARVARFLVERFWAHLFRYSFLLNPPPNHNHVRLLALPPVVPSCLLPLASAAGVVSAQAMEPGLDTEHKVTASGARRTNGRYRVLGTGRVGGECTMVCGQPLTPCVRSAVCHKSRRG